MIIIEISQAGLRALHFVAKSGQAEVAAELVKRGANVNAVSLVRRYKILFQKQIQTRCFENKFENIVPKVAPKDVVY